MTKYAFLAFPMHGHVNPTLPVVRDLVAGGDEVVYCATADFAAQVAATGARLCPFNLDIDTRYPGRELETIVPFVLPQLERLMAEENPDIVVYDNMFAPGHVIPHITKKPAAQWRVVYGANEHWNLAQEEQRLSSAPEPIGANTFDNMISALNDELEKRGQPALTCSVDCHQRLIGAFMEHSEPLTVIFMPREFQPKGETFDERFYFAGPSFLPESGISDPILAPLLAHMEGGPVLYISQGTVFNQQPEFFQMCIDAFADSPYRVVMSKGNPSDARDTATYPSNIFVAPWLPQHEVVKRASVFVSQAGTDSTMQCLHYGVPMVVVPRQIEQMMNGVRVAQLGLGVLVDPGTVTSESLRAAVDKVHGTSSFLERARAMQKAVRASGGSAGAANAFRKYARSLVS